MQSRGLRRLIRPGIAIAAGVFGTAEVGQGGYIHAKAKLAQYLLQNSWTRVKHGESDARPWPWADLKPIARLRVPRYDVDLLVLPDASGRTLAFGPGHLPDSARPGTPGVSILCAHRDTHFAFLRRVQLGDWMTVETPDAEVHLYRVTRTDIVDSRTARITDTGQSDVLLLTTCYPFNALTPGGPMRYVVTAQHENRVL